eukprot:scaffold300754_cov60-Attheya_sp.AAC.3
MGARKRIISCPIDTNGTSLGYMQRRKWKRKGYADVAIQPCFGVTIHQRRPDLSLRASRLIGWCVTTYRIVRGSEETNDVLPYQHRQTAPL